MSTASKISAKAPSLLRADLLKDKLLINGKWLSTPKTFTVNDPATMEVIGTVPEGDINDVRKAIDSACDAFGTFKSTTPRARSDMLRRWADLLRKNESDLSKILSWENGKPLVEAKGEILTCASTFEWFSEAAPHYNGDSLPSQHPNMRLHTIRQPVGVCGIITPWNFPASMIARKVGAAVASGCTSVIKPAAETPYSALAMAALASEAGIPDGVVNVVTTHANIKEVGEELCTNHKVKKISFTGSTPVGKMLMQLSSSTIKKVSFELGGNAPFIVFGDADIDKAVDGAIASKFRGSGQTCICANRFFVHESVYDEFLEKFTQRVKQLRPGHGFQDNTTQGPLINEKSVAKVTAHVEDALAKGGRLLTGGHAIPELGPNFFEPTVIADGDPASMRVFTEETFGPLAVVAKFGSTESMIEMANSVEVGLAGYFYTENLANAHNVSEALEVGMVGINTGLITEVALPFGGVKESGFGRETSKYGLDDYTVIKTVATNVAH